MNILVMMAAVVLISASGSGAIRAADENDVETREHAFEEAMQTPGNFGYDLQSPRIVKTPSGDEHAVHEAGPATKRVKGTITLVGDDVIRLAELDTGSEYEIKVTDAQEKALSTGYAIKADVRDGRLVSYTEIGVPPNVDDIVYSSENLPTDNLLEDYYDSSGFLN